MGGAHGPLFAALWVIVSCGPLHVWDDLLDDDIYNKDHKSQYQKRLFHGTLRIGFLYTGGIKALYLYSSLVIQKVKSK